jgi:protein-disulfide isomerase
MVAVVLVLILGDFAYFSSLERAAITPDLPVAEARAINVETQCGFNEEYQPFSNLDALIQESDAVRGNLDAPVTIIEYFDPNCPHCKTTFPVMNALEKKHGERVRFIYKPVAILGAQSDLQVAALRAAAEAGKFKEMLSLQFENQKPSQGHTMSELKDFADQIGMDGDAMGDRIRDGDYRTAMVRENRLFSQMGFSSVPTVLFNGRVVASRSRFVECFDHFIDEAMGTSAPATEAPAEASISTGDAPTG